METEIVTGFSLSFTERHLEPVEGREKLTKSVEYQTRPANPFIRSFGSSSDSSRDRKLSISSNASMNSEITELSSSQFDHTKEIEQKLCCTCALL